MQWARLAGGWGPGALCGVAARAAAASLAVARVQGGARVAARVAAVRVELVVKGGGWAAAGGSAASADTRGAAGGGLGGDGKGGGGGLSGDGEGGGLGGGGLD